MIAFSSASEAAIRDDTREVNVKYFCVQKYVINSEKPSYKGTCGRRENTAGIPNTALIRSKGEKSISEKRSRVEQLDFYTAFFLITFILFWVQYVPEQEELLNPAQAYSGKLAD